MNEGFTKIKGKLSLELPLQELLRPKNHIVEVYSEPRIYQPYEQKTIRILCVHKNDKIDIINKNDFIQSNHFNHCVIYEDTNGIKNALNDIVITAIDTWSKKSSGRDDMSCILYQIK